MSTPSVIIPSRVPEVTPLPYNRDSTRAFQADKHGCFLRHNILALNNPSPEETPSEPSYHLPYTMQERAAEDTGSRVKSRSRSFDEISAGRILAEKRKKNATASAKFRDRRKQKEKEILERCSLLEKKVHQLELENPFSKQINQLEFDLNQAKLEKFSAIEKLNLLEDEVIPDIPPDHPE
ncbi:hypothetical protein K493DRAFT_362668 [Basidiobolus meristosporus CBS 931.73]|uniref:BZIP domain-containing protein n=1 Tax=Basidiobolus meristosporus CBS 931.73 TaxID=1314790 RepID=A0A1Y1X096_9FUNG|nr:hypothetical protein K493DRAFT_362668 [Basidiobolus meristosporus CBS 931.73]|eukprot:ORX79247.1 hypothetical protein K493DRAFT_362668 [Basidiobolus meristosporus CBS 931.73]